MNLAQAIKQQSKKQLFVSLAQRPGKTGETFYNELFAHHAIDAEYRACTCTDLESDLELVRDCCSGASVTMPYKQSVVEYLDLVESPNSSVNTVVNDNGNLIGYNCDLLGLEDLLADKLSGRIVILGNGAMSENVQTICQSKNLDYKLITRDNWQDRHQDCDILINTTSIGMDNDCPVDYVTAGFVVDCVIGNTRLLELNNSHLSGANIYLAQFKHQFKLYTGIDADSTLVDSIARKLFGNTL